MFDLLSIDIKELAKNASGLSDAVKKLEASGYSRINRGGRFVLPFAIEGQSHIIKLNMETELSRRFAKSCIQNRGNPYLPRVLSYESGEGFSLECVERLQTIDPSIVEQENKLGTDFSDTNPILAEFRKKAFMLCEFFDGRRHPENEMYYNAPEALEAVKVILTCARDFTRESLANDRMPMTAEIDYGVWFYNIFRREKPDGTYQYLFGDPLSPVHVGKSPDESIHLNELNDRLDSLGMERV